MRLRSDPGHDPGLLVHLGIIPDVRSWTHSGETLVVALLGYVSIACAAVIPIRARASAS